MEKQDLLDILDSLDLQLSMGKIDQPTYQTLQQKWMRKLQALEVGAAVSVTDQLSQPISGPLPGRRVASSSPAQSQSMVIEVLACPRCGAPAEDNNGALDLTKLIHCLFCDTVYTLSQGQDNAQKLKQELKVWLDQMIVGSGYGTSGTVDVNVRRFIFNDSLYPSLKKDIDRRLEAFENVPEAPLVQLKETTGFRDYQPNPLLDAIAQGDNQWVKTLSTRVSAQQLQDFAVMQDDKLKLKQLQLRIQSLIYYANIAHHLATSTIASYQLVRQNVMALQKDCQESVREIVDEHYRSYILALDARMGGDVLLLDVLISALDKGRGVAPEAALAQLDRAISQLEKAQQQAHTCTYNPLYTVPLQQGIQKDILTAHIFQAILKCYEIVAYMHPEEFGAFYERLMQYIYCLARIQSADHLYWLLISVGRVMAARAGDAPLPVLMDWNWLDPALESNRHKPSFGISGETAQVIRPHYHPYWVARLNYTEVGGFIDKKGMVREGLILVDATCIDMPLVMHMLSNDPSLPVISAGIHNFNFLEKQVVSLPALLTRDMAEKAMKAYTNQHESLLKMATFKTIGVVYLPAASVRYTSKIKYRNIMLGRLPVVNQDINNILMQTQQFQQDYGV